MSVNTWSLIRFAHVLAAMGWVGGQMFLSGIALPVIRVQLEPEHRANVIHGTAARFAWVANIALLPTLVATGIALAWHRGVTLQSFQSPGYGRLLGIKLMLVALSIGLAAAHGVIATRSPIKARPLAIAGLTSSVAIVVFATALVP